MKQSSDVICVVIPSYQVILSTKNILMVRFLNGNMSRNPFLSGHSFNSGCKKHAWITKSRNPFLSGHSFNL